MLRQLYSLDAPRVYTTAEIDIEHAFNVIFRLPIIIPLAARQFFSLKESVYYFSGVRRLSILYRNCVGAYIASRNAYDVRKHIYLPPKQQSITIYLK